MGGKGEKEEREREKARSLHPGHPSHTHRELKIAHSAGPLFYLSVTWLKLTRNKPQLTTPLIYVYDAGDIYIYQTLPPRGEYIAYAYCYYCTVLFYFK